ncbi:hypothetical protein LTR78_004606 [Recurvomyces mirabilis]|uniref:Uncharacterized protein n=1 Tax=Recurvomyces mirabilis TaxID=574656 RepID=A0AAE0WPE5_9PEZI|nr:hypothetical protein LTR78_004606 [Recurvomyces mirabilis]KAK5152899.1 hypothetical protein LTS14_008007 [Recurvomyces mirabilis]
MGLIKAGIKYGGIYLIAREGLKAVSNHHNKGDEQQQQPRQDQDQNSYQQRSRNDQFQEHRQPQPYEAPPQYVPARAGWSKSSEYMHKSYCNGYCGSSCNTA